MKYDNIVKGEIVQTKQHLNKLYIRKNKLDEVLMDKKLKER